MPGSKEDDPGRETLTDLYVDQDMTTVEVANELGLHHRTVDYWLSKHGLYSFGDTGPLSRSALTVRTHEDGTEYLCNGDDLVEHARVLAIAEFGHDVAQSGEVINEAEPPWLVTRDTVDIREPDEPDISKTQFRALYTATGMSSGELARFAGIPSEHVDYWAERWGFEKPTEDPEPDADADEPVWSRARGD